MITLLCFLHLSATSPDLFPEEIHRAALKVIIGDPESRTGQLLRTQKCGLLEYLTADSQTARITRNKLQENGRYGEMTVKHWSGGSLPYIDNTVNLLVADKTCDASEKEMLRVLAPGGILYREDAKGIWNKKVKQKNGATDAWTHALYDASNNAVSGDIVAGPPYHFQWIAPPKHTRHHERLASITVSVTNGRSLFSICDRAPAASILIDPQWKLIARDAYNGLLLWEREIPQWKPHLQPFRSGPPTLSRRLVATENNVFVTLGIDAPVSKLDAATGRTLHVFENTGKTEEIRLHNGRLFLVVRNPKQKIMAVDAETGTTLWEKSCTVRPTTLAVSGGRVCFLSPRAVTCLNAADGTMLWRTSHKSPEKRPGWSAPTLVIKDPVVLCADRTTDPFTRLDPKTGKQIPRWLAEGGWPGMLKAYDINTGKERWSCLCAEGYHAPVDVFAVDRSVLTGQSRARHGPDFTEVRDLLTGEIVRQLPGETPFQTTMPHHRCHRNRATVRYIITGRTGVEFIDHQSGDSIRHHWTRGVCQYGTVPANGLLYVPPHSCACYIEAKLAGFFAFAPKRPSEKEVWKRAYTGGSQEHRLIRGEAYQRFEKKAIEPSHVPGTWPVYRHDNERTGTTNTTLSADLLPAWAWKGPGALTPPIISASKILVAAVNQHTVYALNAQDGKPIWCYTAGGRIDSPPAYAEGRVVFGCADGCLYCLNASDGKPIWRFLAAPADKHLVADGQLESVWPIHGSVLVKKGTVFFAVGRSSYVDGGMALCALDLATGRLKRWKHLYSRNPETGRQPDEPDRFEMAGFKPDILSSREGHLFMRKSTFSAATLKQVPTEPHLFSPAGFLNTDWWHRTYWIYGSHFYSGYIGWYFAGRETPAGRLLALDGDSIYGFSYTPEYYRGATGRKYHLFCLHKKRQPPQPEPDYLRANRDYPHSGQRKFAISFQWRKKPPLLVRAMTVTRDHVFLAGPSEKALQEAAWFKKDANTFLHVVRKDDGTAVKRYRLSGQPVYDGMAAAYKRLYISLQNGLLMCAAPAGSTHSKEKPEASLTNLLQPVASPDKKDDGRAGRR